VLILGGLSAFGPFSVDMYLPAFPTMTAQLGAADSQVQLTLTTFVIGLALGQSIAGPLSDAFGRRRPLMIGLILYAVASLLCAIAPGAYALAGFRFVQGLGAAAGIVIARAAVRDLYSGIALVRFFSLLMLVNGLGPILAPVIGGQVLTLTSWRGIFVVLVVFGTLLLLASLLGLPETLPPARRRPASVAGALRSYGSLFADRVFVGYALASAFVFAAMFGYISGSPFVLQDIYGLTPQQYSLVFGANALGIMIVGQLNGRLAGRFSPRALLTAGLIITMTGGACLVLAVVTGLGLAGILPPLFLVVSSVGLVMPNATALALADHADNAGTASALLGVATFLIGGFSAPLAGSTGASALPMAILMASLALAAMLAYLVLSRPLRDQADREDDDHQAGDQRGDEPAAGTGERTPDQSSAAGQEQLPAR
jgi:DHA1 family bicyclomycin/chloramphenicol resistance-like MFS transporter